MRVQFAHIFHEVYIGTHLSQVNGGVNEQIVQMYCMDGEH